MASCKEASKRFYPCKMLPLTGSDFGNSDSLWEIWFIRLQSIRALYHGSYLHPTKSVGCTGALPSLVNASTEVPKLWTWIPGTRQPDEEFEHRPVERKWCTIASNLLCEMWGNPLFLLGSLAGVEGPRLWTLNSETSAFSFCSSPSFFSPCAYNICRMTSALYLQLLFSLSPVLMCASINHKPKAARMGLAFRDMTGKNSSGYSPMPQGLLQPMRFTIRLFCPGAWR